MFINITTGGVWPPRPLFYCKIITGESLTLRMIDLVSCVLTRAQTKRVLSKESEQSDYQTCCKPNWDDRGADPTNRE